MLKHYIKIAFRNFKSNRLIFAGSIVTVFLCTLSISLLFSYVHNELTMDDFHKHEKDIYLITVQQSPQSRVELAEAQRYFDFNYKDYPEIETLTYLQKYNEGQLKFNYNDSFFSPEGIIADSLFFKVFDFQLKTGNKNTILSEPGNILLTEKLAQKIFKDEDPIGKSIIVYARRENVFTVKGIIKTPPSNSSITFDFIISNGFRGFSRSGANFILVNNHFNPNEFSEKIRNIGHIHEQFKESVCGVVALDDMYNLSSGIQHKEIFSKSGNKKTLRILLFTIVVIFVISLLNFSNLQIISINSALKKIGINKIIGAQKTQIFIQKLIEILLLIVFSSILITIAYFLFLPHFNRFTGVPINPEVWKVFLLNIAILVALAILAMIYPAIIYTRVSIIQSLKNQVTTEIRFGGRKVMTAIQFTFTILLLIVSLLVVKQLNFMLNKDLGFKSDNIISTKYFQIDRLDGSDEERQERREATARNYDYVKNELASSSAIANFSQGQSPLNPLKMPWKLKGSEKDFSTGTILDVTPEYLEMMGLELVEGRFFEKGRDERRQQLVVINESAKEFWGIRDISEERILNKYWSIPQMGSADGYEIIGVVKNINCEHLSALPLPMYMLYHGDIFSNFLIEFEPGAEQSGLEFTKQLFNKINPDETFNYTFLSDDIEALYQKEKRLSQIYIIFTIITFLISATGLFAISLYDTKKRTKEIGIRKVNGAKVSEILTLLNKDFIKWVAIAFVIATPIAWYTMNKWLENFAYKTELSWWIFALAGLLALGIAMLTVSWQSWRAATRNPVEALRYE
jgi:putative ABC transport system permease protein